MYFAFEESPAQIQRNMSSIGIDLAPHMKKRLLLFHATRPSLYGLEMHLVTMYDLVKEYNPSIVVLDPITDFFSVANSSEVKAAITRIIDFLKLNQITALFTTYTPEGESADATVVGVSSLIDTWLSLRNIENNGERHRGLFVLKARGMAHSNQIRSFVLTDDGIKIGGGDSAGRRTGLSAS